MTTYKASTRGPFKFAITGGDGSVEIGENTADANGNRLNYRFDEKYTVHVIQAPVLSAAADTITVYGLGIGGGWSKIGVLANTIDSEGFIEIKGGWWVKFKVVGTSLGDDPAYIYMISLIPDFSTGVNARTVV